MRAPLLTATLLALSISTGLVGCKGNSIEGKWDVTGTEAMLPGTTAVYEFAGGKATMTLNVNNPQAGQAKVMLSGPYKLEGEKLTINADQVSVDDSKLNPMAKSFMPQIKAALTQGAKDLRDFTVKFDSSDQLLLTAKDRTFTLRRVK